MESALSLHAQWADFRRSLLFGNETMAKNENEAGKQKGNGHEQSKEKSMEKSQARVPAQRRHLQPFRQLRAEFDRLFDDFFHGWRGLPAWAEDSQSRWGVDVDELEDKVVVRAEAPGFEPNDFDIQVRDNQLQLCACQSEEKTEEGAHHWQRQELFRSVPIPSGIDSEHVDAQYRNGVLTVTLPKTEKQKAKRIEVKS
jgi:HSP20 family protein